ncbi:hypothetical protein HY229_02565 [Candidatus Acetothermia bacterium]|nr:hypothetical protein [Candidatus Acetothermia bacterium]MBI3642964.1 hypothetical protein [Candidatus Acetothermia bacterium]
MCWSAQLGAERYRELHSNARVARLIQQAGSHRIPLLQQVKNSIRALIIGDEGSRQARRELWPSQSKSEKKIIPPFRRVL